MKSWVELQVEEIQKSKVELQQRQVDEIQDRQLFDAGTTGKSAGYQKEKSPNKTHKKHYRAETVRKGKVRETEAKGMFQFLCFFVVYAKSSKFFQNLTLE